MGFNHHCVGVRVIVEFQIRFSEHYRDVGLFGLHDWSFDCNGIDLPVVICSGSLAFEVKSGASDYTVYVPSRRKGLIRRLVRLLSFG